MPQATASAAAAVPASAAKPARKPKSAAGHRHRLCTGWLPVVGRAQCRQPVGDPERTGCDHAAAVERAARDRHRWRPRFRRWREPPQAAVWPQRHGADRLHPAAGQTQHRLCALLRSTDGGKTFSKPSTVHADRQEITHRFESIGFDAKGVLHAIWIDKRDLEAAPKVGNKSSYRGAAIYRAFRWMGVPRLAQTSRWPTTPASAAALPWRKATTVC
jgi:hypothetical protein